MSSTGLVYGIRRAWSVVGPQERRRLRWVTLYGVVIAALDTLALVLIYALISLLNNQQVSGVAESLVRALGLGTSDRYRAAVVLLAITSALFVARSLLSVLGLWLTIGATNAAQVDLIGRLLVGHARAPQLLRLERNSSQTLRTIMSSVDQAISGVVLSSVMLVSNLAVAVAVGAGLVLSSPLVAIAVMIYFAVIAFCWARLARGPLERRGRRAQELHEERFRLVLQGLSAAKELQLRGRALFYAEGAVTRTRGINAAMRVATVANGSLRYMLEAALVIGAVLVVGVAGATSGRDAALPAVGLVLAGAFRLLPALNQVLFLYNQVQYSSAAAELVEREVETFEPFASLPREADVAPARFKEELRLDDVGFRYPTRQRPALDQVSVAIRPGQAVGIVGPTGSGKSTLLDVMLGVLEPTSGRVSLDGEPLADCRAPWQRAIGYVPQDVYLVDDTLRANVALGWYGDEVDEGRVLEAVKLAGLEEVVHSLPQGLDTVVGERGVRLSGGQRQRVGIARALYTAPNVLVLDEATSNLDHGTELRIVETLAALRGGVTMIVVTHRPLSVRHCDALVYLEDGRVRAAGTVEDVRRSVPEFDEPATPLRVAEVG